jgi:hypothetical protein
VTWSWSSDRPGPEPATKSAPNPAAPELEAGGCQAASCQCTASCQIRDQGRWVLDDGSDGRRGVGVRAGKMANSTS